MTTSSRTARTARLAPLAVVLAALSLGTVARADPTAADLETARGLFLEGQALQAKGDAKGAVEKFKAADALARTPITAVGLGRGQAAVGNLLEAREAFLAVKRLAEKPGESPATKRARAEAEQRAQELGPRIPSLAIVVTGAPAGATPAVLVDGVAIPAAALAEKRRMNPGRHTVSAQLEGGPVATTTVDLKEGEMGTASLEVTPPPAAAPPPPPVAPPPPAPVPPKPPARGASPLLFGGLGVAVVGAALGGITGALALGKASKAKEQCVGQQCFPGAQPDIDAAKTLGSVSTAAFIIGGAGLGLAVVSLVTGKPPPEAGKAGAAWWVGPSSAGVRGAF